MTSIINIYAHTSNRLVGLLLEQAYFILSNPYLRLKNSPIRTKEIQYIRAND